MPENKPVIDSMSLDHLDEVLNIERSCFSDPWPYSAFLHDIESDVVFPLIARFNKKIIGFCISMLKKDELYLTNIAVLKEYRRKKVGHYLMKRLFYLAEKHNCKLISLDVRSSNETAIKFYNKYGFSILCEKKGYYHNPPEDALIMALNLNERFKSGVV